MGIAWVSMADHLFSAIRKLKQAACELEVCILSSVSLTGAPTLCNPSTIGAHFAKLHVSDPTSAAPADLCLLAHQHTQSQRYNFAMLWSFDSLPGVEQLEKIEAAL